MQTFLTNARVVDGSGAPALEDATVVINDSLIEYVGSAAEAPQPDEDDRVVDVGGKTVMPGLFNVHVHLALRLPFTERRIDQFTVGYRTMLDLSPRPRSHRHRHNHHSLCRRSPFHRH